MKVTKPTPAPKLRPRIMYAWWPKHLSSPKSSVLLVNMRTNKSMLRVAVVPLDDVDRIRKKMQAAFTGSYDGHLHKNDLDAMLRAIGVFPRAKRAKGRAAK